MTAFIFVPLLAMTALYSIALWTYLSHNVVVVVEETAAGCDDVVWPDDPLLDWLWHAVYLAWLVAVWVAPALLFGRILASGQDPYYRPLYSLVFAGLAFWVMFPISLLSTMSAESRWAILHVGLLQRLGQRFGSLATFYLASTVLVAVGAVCLFFLAAGQGVATLAGCAIGLGVSVFLYARMLGRIANLARLAKPRPARKRRPGTRRSEAAVVDPWAVPTEPDEEPAAQSTAFVQPSQMEPLDTPDEEAGTGYDVRFDSGPPASDEARPTRELEEGLPVATGSSPADDEDRRLRRAAAAAIQPDAVEVSRLRRKRQREPQRQVLDGIGGFLFFRPVAVHLVTTTLGFLVFGALIRTVIELWPK